MICNNKGGMQVSGDKMVFSQESALSQYLTIWGKNEFRHFLSANTQTYSIQIVVLNENVKQLNFNQKHERTPS